MKHELKCWLESFDAIKRRKKTFELRRADRQYNEHDIIHLREYDHGTGYTGRQLWCQLGYVLRQFPGLRSDFVVMSLVTISEKELDEVGLIFDDNTPEEPV